MKNQNRPAVYLFGPLLGLTFKETIYWRKLAELYLAPHIETFSPTRGLIVGNADEPFHEEYGHDIMHQARAFTIRDLHDIIQTNAMLGNFEGATRASIGSAIEIGYGFALQRPIITVVPNVREITSRSVTDYTKIDSPLDIHDHPMIRETTLVTTSLKEALRATMHLLLPSSIIDDIDFDFHYKSIVSELERKPDYFWRKG